MAKGKVKAGWVEFIDLCVAMGDEKEMGHLFELFFTLEEKEHLASRYLIIRELLKGELSQREIAQKFKVSIAQITRGSNALKIIPSKLRNTLQEKIK